MSDSSRARAPQPQMAQDDGPSPLPQVQAIGLSALPRALAAGWRDFIRAPLYGLIFAGVYVLGGLVMLWVLRASGREWLMMPIILGFPLIGPFAAVGLYEVSRRLEAGQALRFGAIMGVVAAQRWRQLPSFSAAILVLFLFWMFVAHTLVALFMGLRAMDHITTSPGFLLTGSGLMMLGIGGLIGAGFAGVIFGATVGGIPLVLEREVDYVSAMILSFQAVIANALPMAAWGLLIAALLLIGMAPAFLGLLVVLPVLGHASWHMYRQILADAAEPEPEPELGA